MTGPARNDALTTAAEMSVGQCTTVIAVDGVDDVGLRLLEMGLTPGVALRLVGTAPLGDPLEFELRGYHLSLRRAEAKRIEIAPLARDPR